MPMPNTRARTSGAATAAGLGVPAPFPLGADELRALFQHLKTDQDRKHALAVCKAWHAAMAADPALWPAALVRGPRRLAVHDLDRMKFAEEGALEEDTGTRTQVLSTAAAVHRRAQRVCFKGFADTPDLIIGCLAVLPPGLASLHVATPVAGPLLAALSRFASLAELRLAGDASRVSWQCHAGSDGKAVQVSSKLLELALRYDRPGAEEGDWRREALPVAAATVDFLAVHATRLRSLDVAADWRSGDMARVCRSLPALRKLRLEVMWAGPHDAGLAVEAVALLQELDQLQEVSLAVDSMAGPDDEDPTMDQQDFWSEEEEGDDEDEDEEEDEEREEEREEDVEEGAEGEKEEKGEQTKEEKAAATAARAAVRAVVVAARAAAAAARVACWTLPPLSNLSNLRGLEVRARARLPPDWRQLSQLRSLAIMSCIEVAWGGIMATALAQLTQLSLYSGSLHEEQDYPLELCALPELRCLDVKRRMWEGYGRDRKLRLRLPPAFTRLTALQSITSSMRLSDEAAHLVDGMPGVMITVDDHWS